MHDGATTRSYCYIGFFTLILCRFTQCAVLLHYLSFPDINSMLFRLPSRLGWKRCVSRVFNLMIDNGLEDSVVGSQSLYDVYLAHHPCIGRPSPLLSVSIGDVSVSRLLNYRLRLILHCSDLCSNTCIFRLGPTRDRTPTCQLCWNDIESVFHFLVCCPFLNTVRDNWCGRL